jgi:transposase
MLEYSELTKRVSKLMTVDLNDQIQQLMRSLEITPKQDKDLSDNISFLLKRMEKERFAKNFTKEFQVSKNDFQRVLKNLREHRNYIAHPTPERLNNNNEFLPKYYIKAIVDGLLPFYRINSLENSVLFDYNAQLNYYNNHPQQMYSNGKIKKILQIVTVATGAYILGSEKDNLKKLISKKK